MKKILDNLIIASIGTMTVGFLIVAAKGIYEGFKLNMLLGGAATFIVGGVIFLLSMTVLVGWEEIELWLKDL